MLIYDNEKRMVPGVAKALYGGAVVYEKDGAWHCPNPFWMEAATVTGTPSVTATGVDGLEYSEDGKTWTATDAFFISAGKRIYYRAKSLGRTSSSNRIIPGTGVSGVRVGGDVRSLIEDYKGELVSYAFSRLFYGASKLVDASELVLDGVLAAACYYYMFSGCTALTKVPALPATTLASYCYYEMFNGCTALTEAPELPATTLAPNCYFGMFYECKALTKAPDSLPATTLATGCYEYMFQGCKALTKAPALPATTLVTGCYTYMFSGCTALTEAPDSLPATTLVKNCYYYMFSGCSTLTKAPTLPATTLVTGCYSYMFYGCTNLNEVKVGATSWNTSYTGNWLSGVAAAGTFYKRSSVTIPTGTSGIPSGWTVIQY